MRHESDFEPAGEAAPQVHDLGLTFRRSVGRKPARRSEEISDCLSGKNGWRDAATRLGGAFANPGAATGLTDGKE